MNAKEICTGVLKKLTPLLIIVNIIAVVASILSSATYYFSVKDIDIKEFNVTSETEEFRFESGFGVYRCIQKGTEPYFKIIDSYNKDAGNIDNWCEGINLNEYNLYMKSLTYVNGNISNTEIQEDYMINTYSNGKKLKVLFHNTNNIKKYQVDKIDNTKYTKTENVYGEVEYIYENGYTEVVKEVSATADLVIAYGFDVTDFLKSMLKVMIFNTVVAIVSFLIGTLVYNGLCKYSNKN